MNIAFLGITRKKISLFKESAFSERDFVTIFIFLLLFKDMVTLGFL